MAMPRKLKLMNVFLNGYSYQGVAKSVTLPKLTRKLENYRGAGMNGIHTGCGVKLPDNRIREAPERPLH